VKHVGKEKAEIEGATRNRGTGQAKVQIGTQRQIHTVGGEARKNHNGKDKQSPQTAPSAIQPQTAPSLPT
jgi:hypothetical protein